MNYSKLKVCIVYNGAPHYRWGIFKLLEEEFHCDWYFGPGYGNIKQIPLEYFKKAKIQKSVYFKGEFKWQCGEVSTLLSKDYDVFLVLGEINNISCWWGMMLHNIFNRKRKVYYWGHGMLRIRGLLRLLVEKIFYKLPDGVFVYGDRARELMVNEGLNGNRIFPIHNSLNYESQIGFRSCFSNIYKSHFKNEWPVLFFIGRLTGIKRLDMIVNSVFDLKKQNINVNLVFIGDGSETETLINQVKKYGIQDRTWFYGPCYDEKEKSELISNADLCVAPGNVGLTAMDSLVYGTPVITMDNFDMQMPEFEAIKEGITGTFFKENDNKDLTDKIRSWLCNGQDREEVRKNCYNEIDSLWNPRYQISIFKKNLRP